MEANVLGGFMNLRPSRVVWSAVMLLAFVGVTSSITRTISLIETGALSGEPISELSRIDRGSALFISILVGIEPGSAAYAELEEQTRRFLGKFGQYPITTLIHVVSAGLFMVLALVQFSATVRARSIAWHRWSGRVLVILSIPIGVTGLFFGLIVPFAGFPEAAAIGIFGTWFLFSVLKAFGAIRRRAVRQHREWMIRMFAVALGVSVVRIVGILLALAVREGPATWFSHSVWIGFTVSAVAAEFWIRYTRTVRHHGFVEANSR